MILFPLLLPGYVLTFDMPWGPLFPMPTSTLNYSPLFAIIGFLAPHIGWITQKAILTVIVFLTLFGAYHFVRTLKPQKSSLIYSFAGLLYLFNPFFYTRFITGQWLVLFGYALLPWALRSVYLFLQNPTFRTALPVSVWISLIALTSIHAIGIVAFAAIGLIIYSGRSQWKQKITYSTVIAAIWLFVNAFWLIPFSTGESSASRSITEFSASEMQAFSTRGTILDSPPLSAALLTGFWADDQNRYILPSQLPIWWLGVLIVTALLLIGMYSIIRSRDKLGVIFIILGFIAWLLSIGIAWAGSAWITDILIHAIPLYNGYREPHKWLMLLAVAYVYISSVGAIKVYEYTQRNRSIWIQYSTITILLITPLLFAPTLAWGAAGQLKSVSYPTQWQQARQYLDTYAPPDARVLTLPWHMYLPVHFTGRVVANPASYYFKQHMITGDNFELTGVPPQRQTPLTQVVGNEILPNTATRSNIKPLLEKNNITYILLLKEADWADYSWLDTQHHLEKVIRNDHVILYKVKEK